MNSTASIKNLRDPNAVAYSLTLNLTENDAIALRCLCNRIGGCPFEGPRGMFDNIAKLLDSSGVSVDRTEVAIDGKCSGSIHFLDYDNFDMSLLGNSIL